MTVDGAGQPNGLLTIDCGNSTITCRRSGGRAFATSSAAPDVDGLRAFADAADAAVAVSVVPSALDVVRAVLADARVALHVVGEHLRCPLPLAYETPATLGADRWLGALAAHRRFGAAITVDCGTATTVNVIDADGTFRGGAIGAGLAAIVAGLAQKAPALPAADLDAELFVPAPNTQASLDAGVVLGWVGACERLVGAARRSAAPDATLVVTGGNARRLLRHTGLSFEHVPDLLHDGMVALAAEAG